MTELGLAYQFSLIALLKVVTETNSKLQKLSSNTNKPNVSTLSINVLHAKSSAILRLKGYTNVLMYLHRLRVNLFQQNQTPTIDHHHRRNQTQFRENHFHKQPVVSRIKLLLKLSMRCGINMTMIVVEISIKNKQKDLSRIQQAIWVMETNSARMNLKLFSETLIPIKMV